MKQAGEKYSNGQTVTEQKNDILTYYFENGSIKAQGRYVDGKMLGKWSFNKKEGYLWQIGNFDSEGRQHGPWIRYNPDGIVQKERNFDHGKQLR